MLRKVVLLAWLLVIACSDGDLEIEEIDFSNGSVTFCDLQADEADTDRTNFFNITGDEALILELQSGLLANATSDGAISSNVPSQTAVTYRLFSGTVSNSYFCSEIPPTTPTVTNEIIATAGIVNITTTLGSATSTTKNYEHDITIAELTLINSAGERITDQSGMNYGSYSTSTTSSVSQSFSNYANIDVSACTAGGNTTVLHKVDNDEFLSLEVPNTAIPNMAGTQTLSLETTADATNAAFCNRIYMGLITADALCGGTLDSTLLAAQFCSMSGELSVTTVEASNSTPENPIFEHTLVLNDIVLVDSDGNDLDIIDTYGFGVYTSGQ